MRATVSLSFLLFTTALAHHANAESAAVPFSVADNLFDQEEPATLGLSMPEGLQTMTVFRPDDNDNTFNHGGVITEFNGQLYVQWQTSLRDEDSPDTYVVYSKSADGQTWSEPIQLAESPPQSMTTSGGWWKRGDDLVAFINVWPRAGDIKRGGYTMFATSKDGAKWSNLEPMLDSQDKPMQGIFEQDPRALSDGRIISAFHLQPGLIVAPYYTDDPSGTRGWIRGQMKNLPHEGAVSREIEPSWFRRDDGVIVMVFRDQAESFRKLASESRDRGATWSTPVLTDMPDARTKQSAGNLPDGAAYLVGNPVEGKTRYPLVLVISADGRIFDQGWLLRAGGDALPAMRYDGKYKRQGYSYPKSAVLGDWLYVAYATSKEDIEVTRVPLDSLRTP